MTVEVESTETHETVYTGTLDIEQFRSLLTQALARHVGLSDKVHAVRLRRLQNAYHNGPMTFELVVDHLWYLKPDGAKP